MKSRATDDSVSTSVLRAQDDIDHALARWVDTLTNERPDLLEKIVSEMAKAKGLKLPARLVRVR